MQNIVVIGRIHFTLEYFEFSSNSIEICLVGRAPGLLYFQDLFNALQGPCSHSSGIVTRDFINSDFLPLSSTGSPSHLETYLLYINDKPSVISSQACLFADDCILYRVIQTAQDQLELQEDLDNLEQWAKKWGIAFNAKKCEISHLSHSSFYTPLMVTSRKKSTRPNT